LKIKEINKLEEEKLESNTLRFQKLFELEEKIFELKEQLDNL
jgi:hypothetical protein